MIRRTALFLMFVLTALPAWARDPFEDPVTAQVLPGWVTADGTRMAGLHLMLKPGWKTYWRAPGDAGIPPTFNWTRSRNIGGISATWPSPEVFHESGMRSIGYTSDLVIPLTIAPSQNGQPVHLRGEMELGVCSDICMPHTLHFDVVIDAAGTTPTPRIAAALSQRPYSAQEAGVTSATCRIEPIADGLRIEARVDMPSAGAGEEMVIEPGQPDIWVSEPRTQRTGGTVVATSDMIHVSGSSFALDRSQIRITVIGSTHTVDIQGCMPR